MTGGDEVAVGGPGGVVGSFFEFLAQVEDPLLGLVGVLAGCPGRTEERVSVPDGHKCARLHGHSYTAELRLAASCLDERGFVTDFAALPVTEMYEYESYGRL